MRKILLFICLTLAGCTMVVEPGSDHSVQPPQEELTRIKQVRIAMTSADVKSIMGDHVVIGYKLDNTKNIIDPVKLDSPYRREEFESSGKKYTVLYYFTDVKKADDIIADDELTPLIFESDKLIGKNKDLLFRLRSAQ